MSSEIEFVNSEEAPEVLSLSFFLPLTHTSLDETCKRLLLGAFEFDILRQWDFLGFWQKEFSFSFCDFFLSFTVYFLESWMADMHINYYNFFKKIQL